MRSGGVGFVTMAVSVPVPIFIFIRNQLQHGGIVVEVNGRAALGVGALEVLRGEFGVSLPEVGYCERRPVPDVDQESTCGDEGHGHGETDEKVVSIVGPGAGYRGSDRKSVV